MIYEGGCWNVVHLKAKVDPIRRDFEGVFCLHERKRWNSIAKFSSDFHWKSGHMSKKKQSSPSTHLAPHFFEYTLGIHNTVKQKRFNQSRKGGSFFWIRRHLRLFSCQYWLHFLPSGFKETQKNLRRLSFCVWCGTDENDRNCYNCRKHDGPHTPSLHV